MLLIIFKYKYYILLYIKKPTIVVLIFLSFTSFMINLDGYMGGKISCIAFNIGS